MDSIKRRDNITDQELLDLLDDPNEDMNLSFVDDEQNIFGFIATYSLKGGNDKIPLPVLFNLYNIWSKESITKNNLRNQLKDLFKIDSNDNVYLELKESQISDMLLKVLSKKERTEKSAKHLHKMLNKFLKDSEIESGTVFIQDYVLFALYSRRINTKMRFKAETFTSGLKNLLEYKVDVHNTYWFGINKDNLGLSQEEMETARMLYEKEKTIKKI